MDKRKLKLSLVVTLLHFVLLNFIIQNNFDLLSLNFCLNILLSIIVGITMYVIMDKH